MPLQNRVTPLGELVADPARGLVYGNRVVSTMQPAGFGGVTPGGAGSPAGSSSEAGGEAPSCGRASSRSSSSSTRRRRSRRDTARARSAGARTTTASLRSGASSTPTRSERTRSTRNSTPSVSLPAHAVNAITQPSSTPFPMERSSWSGTSRSSCSAHAYSSGRPPVTASDRNGPTAPASLRSRHRHSSRFCAPAGIR